MRHLLVLVPALLSASLLSGCVSYGVGSTAAVVPAGERTFATLVEATPMPDFGSSCDPSGASGDCLDNVSTVVPMISSEVRIGIDGRSDWGVRLVGYSGLVATYKRQLSRDSTGLQVAAIGGVGVLNGLNTLAGEATLVVSVPERTVTPYGGLRVQQPLPINNSPQDRPTAGGFAGVRFGSSTFGISPEVGVYYDPSALGLRRREVVVVPVVTLHGRGFLSGLFPGF